MKKEKWIKLDRINKVNGVYIRYFTFADEGEQVRWFSIRDVLAASGYNSNNTRWFSGLMNPAHVRSVACPSSNGQQLYVAPLAELRHAAKAVITQRDMLEVVLLVLETPNRQDRKNMLRAATQRLKQVVTEVELLTWSLEVSTDDH